MLDAECEARCVVVEGARDVVDSGASIPLA
jgi:hypothetical protein